MNCYKSAIVFQVESGSSLWFCKLPLTLLIFRISEWQTCLSQHLFSLQSLYWFDLVWIIDLWCCKTESPDNLPGILLIVLSNHQATMLSDLPEAAATGVFWRKQLACNLYHFALCSKRDNKWVMAQYFACNRLLELLVMNQTRTVHGPLSAQAEAGDQRF